MGVTQAKFDSIKSSMISDFNTTLTHLGVGSGTTTPTSSDTTLVTETTREAFFGTSTGSDFFSCQLFLDTTENNGNDIREAGTFNALSSGTMYNRALTNAISKTSSIEVFLEVKFVFTLL